MASILDLPPPPNPPAAERDDDREQPSTAVDTAADLAEGTLEVLDTTGTLASCLDGVSGLGDCAILDCDPGCA